MKEDFNMKHRQETEKPMEIDTNKKYRDKMSKY